MTGEQAIEPPRRRFRLALTLHADSLDAACHELRAIANGMEIDGPPAGSRACGGPDAGYTLTVTEDESVTAESYRESLTAYIERERAERA